MTITRVVFGTGAYIQVVPGSGHRSALTPGKDGVKSITWLAHGLLGFETDDGRLMTVYPPPGTVVEETGDGGNEIASVPGGTRYPGAAFDHYAQASEGNGHPISVGGKIPESQKQQEPNGLPSGPTSAAGEAALPGKARGRVQR